MTDNGGEPLVKLDPNGVAPILSYNVAQPTSYSGRNFIELDLDNIESPFTELAIEPPGVQRTQVKGKPISELVTDIRSGMQTAFADKRLFPNVQR